MFLPTDLVNQFVKATKDDKKVKTETIVYGTVDTVNEDGTTFVKFDGSDISTPVLTTAVTKPEERVTVMIKNHTATITGNITSPSARAKDVKDIPSNINAITRDLSTVKQSLSGAEDDIDILQGHVIKLSTNYVVEHKNVDIWTYDKWNNGKAECWGKCAKSSVNASAKSFNGLYYSEPITVDFPVQFSEVPMIFVSGGDPTRMLFVHEMGSTVNKASFVVVSNSSDQTSVDMNVSIHAIGKYAVTKTVEN